MKTRHFCLALAMPLVMASCSSELEAPDLSGDEATVVLSATIPGDLMTRSDVEKSVCYSWGERVSQLHYAIYAEGSQTPLFTGDTDINVDTGKKLSVSLVKGRTYNVLFWAQAEGAPYSFDDDTQIMTIDYSKMEANNDKMDAFFACDTVKVAGDITKEVTLRRPFAQVNFGTDDVEVAKTGGMTAEKTSLSAKLYNQLNLKTGEVTGDEEVRTFSMTAMPTTPHTDAYGEYEHSEEYPYVDPEDGKEYDYVAMAYMLVPAEKQLLDVTMVVDDEANYSEVYHNLPVQRNFRTNAFGSIFTNPVNYNVVINPEYNTSDYDISVWNGDTTGEKISGEEDEDGVWVFKITRASQLARIAYAANNGATFEDTKFILECDINLNYHEWNPIANGDSDFEGIFDGNGHTIYNLYVSGDKLNAGLFGSIASGEVKNLTIVNAEVSSTNSSSNVGVLAGTVGTGASVDNVTITGDVKISGTDEVGGLTGRDYYSAGISNVTIDANKGSYVNGDGAQYVGGVIGYALNRGGSFTALTTNLDVNGTSSTARQIYVGGIAGGEYSECVFENCTASGNLTLTNNYHPSTNSDNLYLGIGGIYGINSVTAATITDCSFEGDITVYDGDDDVTSTVKSSNADWKEHGKK